LTASSVDSISTPGVALAGGVPVSKWALWAFWLSILGTVVVVSTFAAMLALLS
jgi:hypothetical protein